MKRVTVIFRRQQGWQGNPQRQQKQRGIALLEVLIAFFVLSIGLLGLAGMQMKALQFNQASFQRSQATISANDMLDRLRLNKSAASAGSYKLAFGDSPSGSGVVVTDLSSWLNTLKSNLPNGQGSIDCDIHQICAVGIRWTDRFGANAAAGTDWESLSVSGQL